MTTTTTIHSGNYYTRGAKRVLEKLGELGIEVSPAVFAIPATNPRLAERGLNISKFSNLDHALFDRFEGRDFTQARALIENRPAITTWAAIRVLDDVATPSELSHEMLCQ